MQSVLSKQLCYEYLVVTSTLLCRPVLLEVPHFASLRGQEREVTILRSDDSRTWKEHPVVTTEEAVQKCLSGNFEGEGDYVSPVHGCTALPLSAFLLSFWSPIACICADYVVEHCIKWCLRLAADWRVLNFFRRFKPSSSLVYFSDGLFSSWACMEFWMLVWLFPSVVKSGCCSGLSQLTQ